jgi:murein DD-endopeptidase MepM/ murein hydrolase activator NlpD
MRRIYGIVFALSVIFIFKYALAEEKVFIDNNKVHEYKGKLGKWVIVRYKNALASYSKEYSTPISEIYAVNNILKNKDVTENYVFIPFSQKYLDGCSPDDLIRTCIGTPDSQFIWPVENIFRITSVLGLRWGKFHSGLDIPVPRGTPVVASRSGMVTFAEYTDGYGKTIEIEHGDGYLTRYAHNSVNLVKKGDFVKKGQVISLAGSSGNSTGSHVHFEIRSNDVPLDPLDFLPQNDTLKIIHTLKNWK